MGNGILVAGGNRERDRAQPRVRPRAWSASASSRSPRRRPTTASPIRTRGTRPAQRCATTRPRSPTPTRSSLVLWDPIENPVVGNDVSGSGLADLAVGSLQPDLAEPRQLLRRQHVRAPPRPPTSKASRPARAIRTADDWTGGALDLGALVGSRAAAVGRLRDRADPGACGPAEHARRRHRPARSPPRTCPSTVDIDAIALPTRPPGVTARVRPLALLIGWSVAVAVGAWSSRRRSSLTGRATTASAAPAPPGSARRAASRSSRSSAGGATRRRTIRSSTRVARALAPPRLLRQRATDATRRWPTPARGRHDLLPEQARHRRATGRRRCSGRRLLRATPAGSVAYYRPGPGVDPARVRAVPPGLVMMVGG